MKRDEADSCCFSSLPLSYTGERPVGGRHTHAPACTKPSTHLPWESSQLFPIHSPCTLPASSCGPGPKHLCTPDLVPLGTGSGPLAADCRFLARSKAPNGIRDDLHCIITVHISGCLLPLMVYYTGASLGFITPCSLSLSLRLRSN